MLPSIKIGYEIGTGEQVDVPESHIIVTGLTNNSGKSTTLETLIINSGLKALVFKTKSGEKVFQEGNNLLPFYREKTDWQYVESLLEAVMKERLKFERAWIIKACKGAKTLQQVYEKCIELEKSSKRSLEQSVYSTLVAYFEKLLPELEKIELSNTLDLNQGINIMDLQDLNDEVQSVIISSCIEQVQKNSSTIVIIPECWKFIPQKRGNPVKLIAEKFIRQGATKKNYLWLDSQDITGVDKSILKQCSTWILGLQIETNEVQHTIDQIPVDGKSKPTAHEIQTLKKGHFIVCTPQMAKSVYVQPYWLQDDIAIRIARKEISVESILHLEPKKTDNKHQKRTLTPIINSLDSSKIFKDGMAEGIKIKEKELMSRIEQLTGRISYLEKLLDQINKTSIYDKMTDTCELKASSISAIEDDMMDYFRQQAADANTPKNIEEPEHHDEKLEMGARIMLLILKKYNQPFSLHTLKLLAVIKSHSTFGIYKNKLLRMNFITETDGMISITPLGIENTPNEVITCDPTNLFEMWRKPFELGAGNMLTVLFKYNKETFTKAELMRDSGIRSESTFGIYKNKLLRAGLIKEEKGKYSIHEDFFFDDDF